MKAALIGNGLSMACSKAFGADLLAKEVAHEFSSRVGGLAADQALKKLAKSMHPSAGEDLESLIGPLDVLGGSLGALGDLSLLAGTDSDAIKSAIESSRQFAVQTYRTGVSYVLDLIAKHSIEGIDHAPVSGLCEKLAASSDTWCLGTLNYDGILLSAAKDHLDGRFADLADGRPGASVEMAVVPSRSRIEGQKIRSDVEIPRDFKIVNLHGYLGWLRRGDQLVKFKLDDLREREYWKAWRAGDTEWAPHVVLTNQSAKSRWIQEEPFRSAYVYFGYRMAESQQWLIIGYGFGDEVLNKVIRLATTLNPSTRKCHVVGYGDDPSKEKIRNVLGDDLYSRTVVCDHGMPDALSCKHSISDVF